MGYLLSTFGRDKIWEGFPLSLWGFGQKSTGPHFIPKGLSVVEVKALCRTLKYIYCITSLFTPSITSSLHGAIVTVRPLSFSEDNCNSPAYKDILCSIS